MSCLDPGNFAKMCFCQPCITYQQNTVFSCKFPLRQQDAGMEKDVCYLEQYSDGFQLYNLAVHITAEILAQLKG